VTGTEFVDLGTGRGAQGPGGGHRLDSRGTYRERGALRVRVLDSFAWSALVLRLRRVGHHSEGVISAVADGVVRLWEPGQYNVADLAAPGRAHRH
jgi:hypothetical protein